MENGWQFGFHDNTALGWVITAAYFVAAVLCVVAARRSTADQASAKQTWLTVGIGLTLLGLNKQLDFQDWLRFSGRDLSLSLGIYGHKNTIRIAFLVLLAAIGAIAALRWHHRYLATLLGKPCLLAGLGLLAVFIVLSGLHADQLTRWDALLITRPEWHWILELGALLLVACSAVASLAPGRRQNPVPE